MWRLLPISNEMMVSMSQSLLTTATPKITTNSSDPTPMTITAIAHCGMSEFCSMFSTVGRIRCFGITEIDMKKIVKLYRS